MPGTSSNNTVINLRAPAGKRDLIDRAAQIAGKNRSEFILDASCEKAREILADQTSFVLDREAWKRFNALIEAPLPTPEALIRLLRKPAPWER